MGGAVALRAEALREALPDFYAQAVADAEVDPIAPPEIDITVGRGARARSPSTPGRGPPDRGHPRLRRAAGHRPVARGDRRARSTRRSTGCARPMPSWSRWDARRSTVTTSPSTSTGTAAGGDEVVDVDGLPLRGGQRPGRARGLDDQLRGAKVGDILAFAATPAGDAGEVSFRVLVKDVKEKKLPELDRRVGRGELGVRHGRRAARRPAGPDRAGEGPAGPAGPARDRPGRPGRAGRRRRGARGPGRRGGAPAGPRPQPPPRASSRSASSSSWRPPGAPATTWWPRCRARGLPGGQGRSRPAGPGRRRGPRGRRRGAGRRARRRWPSAWAPTRPSSGASSTTPAGPPRYARSNERPRRSTWLLDHVAMVDEEGNPVSRDELVALTDARLQEDDAEGDGERRR